MMQTMGNLEWKAFAYIQLRNLQALRTGDLCRALGITGKQERELFTRLDRGRLIAQVRRGLYLVPPRLPLGGAWSPDEASALNALLEDREGRYQITGPNAFNRYGFDSQVPTRIYAYNNRLSGERIIGSVAISLIKVADERLGDTEETVAANGARAFYSSRARTLVDGVYDWSRFDSLPRAYNWIRGELAANRVDIGDLVQLTIRYGNRGTVRRIGALLDQEGVAPALLLKLQEKLPPSTGLIPWVPIWPKRGKVDRRWGVVLNDRA